MALVTMLDVHHLRMPAFYVKLTALLAAIFVTCFFLTRLDVIITWQPRDVQETVHVTFVSCGGGINESVVMMKSMILFSRAHLVLHIFTEPDYMPQYIATREAWPDDVKERVEFDLHEVSFPETTDGAVGEWMKLCKPCSSQRLFIHELLPEVDAVLYVDTDVLFLSPVEELWRHFRNFGPRKLAGLSMDQEPGYQGFYDAHPEIPHYGDKGVNAGVMLMNLTRVRASTWLQEIVANYGKYKDILLLGDQDLLNIYFNRTPELLYVSPCEWNYRAGHCNQTSTCHQAEETGARLLHGMNEIWFTDDQPAFRAVYETIQGHSLTSPSTVSLISRMYDVIQATPPTHCGKVLSAMVWYLFNNAVDDAAVFLHV